MLEPISEPGGAVLWEPSPDWLRRSQLTRYTDWLARERGLRFDTYEALRRWSVTEVEAFWDSIWEYFAVRGTRPNTAVLVDRRMPGTDWFPGSLVNYAEHVFRDRDRSRTAVLHGSETAPLSSCDWAALESLTRRIRAGLLDAGVARGDRVAALLPNCLKKLHLHVDLGPGDRLFWFTTTGWMMWNFLVGGMLTEAAIVLYDGSPKHPDLSALWDVCADAGVTVFGSSAGYLTACMTDDVDLSGKPLEVPVKRILMGAPPDQVVDRSSLRSTSTATRAPDGAQRSAAI